jgi:hypothetical protein
MAPSVRSGQAVELNLFPVGFASGASPARGRLERSCSPFMGYVRSALLVLLYSIGYMAHDKSATRFYCTMLICSSAASSRWSTVPTCLSSTCAGSWWGLCSFSAGGLLVHQSRRRSAGARKVLLMTHIAGYGLLAGILVLYHRTGSALWTDPNVAHNFTTGDLSADVGGAGGQERAGSAAHLDSRSHGSADPCQFAASPRSLLRYLWRVSGGAHAQLWSVADRLGGVAHSGSPR